MMLRRFDLPLLEDANSVQMALMKVIQMLGSGELEHKTAGLMLYALQTASINLRNTEFEADDVTDVVIDRDTVPATCINGQQWFEEDFEAENEEEAEEEGDEEATIEPAGDAKKPAVSANPNTNSAENKPEMTTEQVRKQVQGMFRDWLLEKATQKAQ